MNNYALNIDTKYLQKKIVYLNDINEYNFTFLDHIKIDNINVYYDILNNIEEFKLKNLYNYIYKRIKVLDKNNNLTELNIRENIDSEKLNNYLNKYINESVLKGIFIINSIQQYYYPIKF
jgi:hypothetical protein